MAFWGWDAVASGTLHTRPGSARSPGIRPIVFPEAPRLLSKKSSTTYPWSGQQPPPEISEGFSEEGTVQLCHPKGFLAYGSRNTLGAFLAWMLERNCLP